MNLPSISQERLSKLDDNVLALATSAITIVTNKLFEMLLPLLSIVFGFVIWKSIPDPNPYQLIGLGLYGMFFLVPTIIWRRK